MNVPIGEIRKGLSDMHQNMPEGAEFNYTEQGISINADGKIVRDSQRSCRGTPRRRPKRALRLFDGDLSRVSALRDWPNQAHSRG